MQSTTIYYWVYQLTGDKLKLGLVGLAEVIPAVLCSLFSGHFVDLKEKKKMLVVCIAAYLLLGCALFLLTTHKAGFFLAKDVILYLIYTCVFIGGIIRAFFGPASFALLGMLVPRELYPNATSWSSMAWQMGAVLGPLTAGAMIAWKGTEMSMLLVILLELIPLAAILAIREKPILKKRKGADTAQPCGRVTFRISYTRFARRFVPGSVFGIIWRGSSFTACLPERDTTRK